MAPTWSRQLKPQNRVRKLLPLQVHVWMGPPESGAKDHKYFVNSRSGIEEEAADENASLQGVSNPDCMDCTTQADLERLVGSGTSESEAARHQHGWLAQSVNSGFPL